MNPYQKTLGKFLKNKVLQIGILTQDLRCVSPSVNSRCLDKEIMVGKEVREMRRRSYGWAETLKNSRGLSSRPPRRTVL